MLIEKNSDSFMVFMCTEGSFELFLNDEKYVYQTGDTILLPAILTSFILSEFIRKPLFDYGAEFINDFQEPPS